MMSLRSLANLACLWAVLGLASAEVQDFSIILPPTDLYIHYADGYLRGPGATIDLTDLTFTASNESFTVDDMFGENDDGGKDDGIPRRLDGGIDINIDLNATAIDIVSFELPSVCASSRNGCDWTQLGVGGKLEDGSLRWCCSADTISAGICVQSEHGRLIVVDAKFHGERHWVSVPRDGPMAKKLKNDVFKFEESGRYVVVFANCNELGRQVTVQGEAVWKSAGGYLPGELFGFMYFYTALTVVYFLLFLWYFCLMQKHASSRIPIEKWILATIALGLAELIFCTADYYDWNSDGVRHSGVTYLGILLGVFKHGISRCLIVMVSLGWGVVRDSLGPAMIKIVVLGIIYVGIAAARDLVIVFAVEDMQKLSYDREVELFDLATIFTFVVAAVDVIFVMWILDALNGTMMYLENMGQSRKLARYLRLRTILLFAILFATVWAVFSLVDTYDEDGIVREEREWIVDAATELNYLFVLIGVAALWKPNPNAKEYAYVMELPAMGGDGETELELSGVVPSAMDDDEQEIVRPYGNGHDDRFKIDDAEAT